MILLIIALVVLLLVFMISATTASSHEFKYYRKAYDNIIACREIIQCGIWDEYGETDVYKDGTIKIKEGVYIFTGFWLYMSPYELYWHFKMMRYIKHIKSTKLYFIYTV